METNDNNQPIDDSGVDTGTEASAEQQQQPDPVHNLKSEFQRKFSGLNEKLESILQSIQSQQQEQQQRVQANQPSIREVMESDPDVAAQMIEERAVRKAEQRVQEQVRLSQASQAAVFDIQSKYSEFAQEGSEAAKLAIEKAARLPQHLRGTPEGVKLAMMDVVSELGLVPTQRKTRSSNDDFSISGQSSPSRQQRKADPARDIDPNTLAFAQLVDPSIAQDPKRLEALKKASQRKKWNTYE